MTPRLEVKGASVRFGDATALDDVDLAVAPAEVVAVLGASGSGKSTLLRSIAGLQQLSAGRVELDGIDLTDVEPHKRGVGLMFQDHALFPHRDVFGNVGFGLRMKGLPPAEVAARVTQLLGLVGLAGKADRSIQTLSGGEQQRVALARALAPEPKLLLLDEPLGALDRSLRERLVVELQALFRELGLTVVAVTHDQLEAFTLADRIVVLHRGAVARVGTPAEVWDEPRSLEVAELLGFGNLAPLRHDGTDLVTPWGTIPGAARAREGADAVLIRPGGVHVHPGGTRSGRVASRSFGGARSTLVIDVADAPPLQADVPSADAPSPGSLVRFDIDPLQVRHLRGWKRPL